CVGGPPDFAPTSCTGALDFSPGCACGPIPQHDSPAAPFAAALIPGACNDEQIDAFLACVPQLGADAGAGCDRFFDAGAAGDDRACSTCLFPGDAGGRVGALLSMGAWPNVAVNVAGCIATATPDDGNGCSLAYAAALGCATGDCFERCGPTGEATTYGCLQEAMTGTCA